MKPYLILAAVACLFLALPPSTPAAELPFGGCVYVIPIHWMIERGLVYAIRRGVAEATEKGAAVIILDMNTPGGRLDATEDIIGIITDVKVPTYTFVNPDAMS